MRLRRLTPLAAFALIAGCSSDQSQKQIAAMNTSNMQRLCSMYAAHQNGVGGRGPNDEAEFKTFIKTYNPNSLSAMGIDVGDLDKLFTSERDGKPFKIRYKIGGGRGSVAPVIFEQDGVNGRKQVGFTGGKGPGGGPAFEEVDDTQYKALLEGKMTNPPSEAAGAAGGNGGPGAGGRPINGPPAGAQKGPGG
jgi:hypothetical protein